MLIMLKSCIGDCQHALNNIIYISRADVVNIICCSAYVVDIGKRTFIYFVYASVYGSTQFAVKEAFCVLPISNKELKLNIKLACYRAKYVESSHLLSFIFIRLRHFYRL